MFTRKTDRGDQKPESDVNSELEKKDIAPEPKPTPEPAPTPLKTSPSLKGSSQMVPSIIGEDLTVEGNIISKGEVQLEGEVKGDVNCTSLVIGDKALVEGGVVAEDVIVRGRVVGSVRGHRVTLQSSSHVEGDIFHQSLAIEQGAFFEGKSRRSDDPIADAMSAKSGGLKSSSSQGLSGSPLSGSTKSDKPSSSSSESSHAAE